MFRKSLILATALVSASCSHNVFVVDEFGTPLEDAQIRPLTRSFSHTPIKTGKNGSAFLRQDHPPIESLHVAKAGYLIPDAVNFALPKPITVVLKKAP